LHRLQWTPTFLSRYRPSGKLLLIEKSDWPRQRSKQRRRKWRQSASRSPSAAQFATPSKHWKAEVAVVRRFPPTAASLTDNAISENWIQQRRNEQRAAGGSLREILPEDRHAQWKLLLETPAAP
jgi:hypothetical protein